MRAAQRSSSCKLPQVCRLYRVHACQATSAIPLTSSPNASPHAHSHAHLAHSVPERALARPSVQEALLVRPHTAPPSTIALRAHGARAARPAPRLQRSVASAPIKMKPGKRRARHVPQAVYALLWVSSKQVHRRALKGISSMPNTPHVLLSFVATSAQSVRHAMDATRRRALQEATALRRANRAAHDALPEAS